MKKIAKTLMLALLVLAVTNVFAQKLDEKSTMEKIQALNNKLAQAMVDGDDNTILSYYTNDAVSLPNYNPGIIGIESIRKYHLESKEMGNKVVAMKFATTSVEEYGNALVEVGSYDVTMSVKNAEKPINDKGKYLTIWEKQADGTFKMAYEIWNSNTNPMQRMKGQQKEGVNPNRTQEQKQERLNQKTDGQTRSGEKNPNKEVKKK